MCGRGEGPDLPNPPMDVHERICMTKLCTNKKDSSARLGSKKRINRSNIAHAPGHGGVTAQQLSLYNHNRVRSARVHPPSYIAFASMHKLTTLLTASR